VQQSTVALPRAPHKIANGMLTQSLPRRAGMAGVLGLLKERGELRGQGSLRAVEWAGRTNDMKPVALQVLPFSCENHQPLALLQQCNSLLVSYATALQKLKRFRAPPRCHPHLPRD